VVYEGNELVFVIRRVTGLDYAEDMVIDWNLVPKSLGDTSLPQEGERSGSVTFAPGETEKTIRVPTYNDEIVNQDQRFYLAITSEDPRVHIEGSAIEGVVMSNDADISITDIQAVGTDVNGLVIYNATITRSSALGFSHEVTWDVYGVGENPARLSDFVTPENRTIHFSANSDASATSDTQTVTFRAIPGLILDGIRGFEVKLYDEVNNDVVLGTDAARANIVPTGVSISVAPVLTSLLEGSTAQTVNQHQFQVNLSEEALGDITVHWSVVPYSTDVADSLVTADLTDFHGAFPSGTVTIAQGNLQSDLIAVTPWYDSQVEQNQRYYVQISVDNNSVGYGGVVVERALGIIVNDDALVGFATPDMVFSGAEGAEGDVGSVLATVTRTGFARSTVTINWHVELVTDANISEADRAALNDFVDGVLPSGYIEMVAGQTATNISIPVLGNNILENSEKFRIVLDLSLIHI
jgi:hypothetical protein